MSTWHANGGLWTAVGRPPRKPPAGARGWRITRVSAAVSQDVSPRDTLVMGVDKPDATNTGIYPGSVLTVTTAHTPVSGTTYRNLDIRNAVSMTGTANVTYRNCIFRGASANPSTSNALVRAWTAHSGGHQFIDCTFLPQTPHWNWNGIMGYGFTLMRCDIGFVVDGIDFYNTSGTGADDPGNITVQQSYIHDLTWWNNPPDTSHTDGSHCDGIQWQGTTGAQVLGNTITGQLAPAYTPNYYGTTQATSGIIIKPDAGAISGAVIERNWLGGGQFTVNIANRASNPTRTIDNIGSISYNRFSRDQRQQYTGGDATGTIIMPSNVQGTFNGNVYDDTNTPVTVRHNG